MTARGYEFYLWVFNSISRYRVEHEKIKFISTSGYVIFCLWYKHRINSCEKGAIYYVTITTVISSRVKITCYLHVWRYEVFSGKLTWYFTGVYIIKVFTFTYFKGTGKRGHIVAHDVSWAAQTGKHLLRTQNVSEQNQKHFLCPGHKICVRNKCCARGQTG